MARVEEADELYGLPLDEFVAARTGLAKRLREEGRGEEAAEVGGLRKPPVALWAVNQLARRRPAELEHFLHAAGLLRAGTDEGAADELRGALAALVREAGAVLAEAGHGASDATLQRVATTLRAAVAAGEEERGALARGALEREPEPAGFEAMAALAGTAAPARPRAKAAPRRAERVRRGGAAAEERRARAEAADDERRARVEAAERALDEARARERELRDQAAEAERAAERARSEAARAAADVEAAERALARARGRATG